jgi:energy-converting hydrogenase Eha subunit A
MSAIIPDSLDGALVLSLIDFFLSFLVISLIGVVLAGFPLLNHLHDRITKWRATARAPTPVQAAAVLGEIPEEDVAVIAAAVYAMLGPHRVLHISEIRPGERWTAAGRLVHHESHVLTHHPKH